MGLVGETEIERDEWGMGTRVVDGFAFDLCDESLDGIRDSGRELRGFEMHRKANVKKW